MKLILDVDTGIDDALAIAYALGSEEAELLGITCCFGNVTVDTAVKNSFSILHLLGKDGIPVCGGENRTFRQNVEFAPPGVCRRVHGENGIGDILIQGAEEKESGLDAVRFMAEMAEKYGKDLSIVATAALTNLARFLEQYPEQAKKVGRIAFMGGALTVPGNITPYAEANIAADPEAARYVFESRIPILMVGLDVTLKTYMSGAEMERCLSSWNGLGEAGEKFFQMARHYCNNEVLRGEIPKGAVHDPMAVASVLHPEWFCTLEMNMTVDIEAPLRGRTIGDPKRRMDLPKTASVCIDADENAFMKDFVEMVGRALTGSAAGKVS